MNNAIYNVYEHKKLKWNILILVILVMLTVAMMGLLTMSFLKQMFSYTINLDWYYKSYYLSKAWLELALTEIDNSDIWFTNHITWTDNIFTQNLCQNWDCSVDLHIRWRWNFLSERFFESTGCTSDSAFTLSDWESFALPLFFQKSWLSNYDILQWLGNTQTQYVIHSLWTIKLYFPNTPQWDSKLNLSLVFSWLEQQLDNLYIAGYPMDKDTISNYNNELRSNWINVEKIRDSKVYLMIWNANSYPVSFCFNSQVELPATKFYVVSLWNYQWKYVGMQAIYAQPIPSFMFYGYNWN